MFVHVRKELFKTNCEKFEYVYVYQTIMSTYKWIYIHHAYVVTILVEAFPKTEPNNKPCVFKSSFIGERKFQEPGIQIHDEKDSWKKNAHAKMFFVTVKGPSAKTYIHTKFIWSFLYLITSPPIRQSHSSTSWFDVCFDREGTCI